eukprot:TRINITY_DN1554_c0_g1_i2.p1 TRINITY_DN1554_c0_g1~~TRINITY_DN1554_c0_g1_i2.p1  ORF type:complete len:1926 (+),score=91.64 TRINITY_DN1554_c0_g1_i2:1624-7401(+)
MSEYSNELTFEVWIRIADPSQSSTLLEIQDVSKKTQFKAVLSASAFICYPNVNSLTSTAFAKITTDMTRGWSHLTCVVNGTASKTTVFFNNGTQALSSAASNVPISVQTTGIFNAFIGNNFVGYLRELRLWKNILSQERISLYRYQGIDTTDIILQPTLLLYFPFDTESDVSLFHSGLTSVDPAPAKFVQLEDHLSIYYAESDTQLLICPVGFVLSENQCISPEFDIKITDLQTDYKVELIKNLPDTSTSFSYKWQYPEVSPADPELQEYLNQKIKNMTHNSLLIFKPALKTKYTISFSVDILPSIYNKVFGTISITKSGDMEYNIDCPVLSLNETEITLSNLNSSNVTVLAQFTQCMVPYVINSVEWQVVDGRPEVEFFSTSNSSKEIMTISQPNFASYDIGVRYEVEVTANVSMESSEGEKFFTFPNASAYITRHAYKLTFISNNTYTILPHEPMQVSGKYRVMRNNIYDPSVDAEVEVDIHCPSEFSTTTCNQLKNGSALHPYERIQKEINPGTYTFIVDGEWRTLKDSEAVYVTVLPPDPFIENKNVSIFYDYVVYQLSANTELECSMADMKYKWFYYGEYDALSEKYEVKLEKKNIMEPKKLVAEIYCNTTNKRLYDSYRDVYEPDSSFKLNIDTKYSLSPLKDPIVVNSDEGNGGDRGGYVLEIKDLVDNCWVPSQVIPFSAPETEVFLPFTNKLRVVKYKGTSITEKVYNVSMINVHSINVGNYINKYMNSSEDFTKLLYTIMHVRNTHNKFSTTQRSLILNYLSTFTYNGTQHNTFLPLYIAALKHIGSELSTIETTELWLDTVAHCLKVRNEFLWSDWEATVQNITEMLSQVLVPLIKSFSLSTARQINLVKKTKGIIAILQEWILSELSVYENYTLNNDLYSISAFSFSTHLPPLILNQVLSFNHSKQAIVLDLPLSFLENGIFSETNRSTFFSFGLTAVSYSTKYLFNENFTALTPISKGQLNVSLHYQDENGTFTQLVQGEKVASALFKPVANFGKIVSPKNISESYCYCSGFGVENITCRTRIDFNSSAIVCEFDSTGPLFASVDYVPFVEPPPFFGNVILLSVYGSGVLLLLFSFICLCERWDKSDCKKMDSANDVKQIYDQLQTYALSVYSLPYSFMGTIILVAKLFHPFVGILFKYNPVISRTNRISLTFFFMQTMSTFILFILKQWNVEPFVATYGYFWCCFAASLGLWLVYMVIMWAYHVLMCKSYEVRTCVMKDADPYAKCGIMDATYRQEKEGFGGESKSVDGVDEDNLWETFNDAKEENTKVAGGRDESNIRKQTEEGRVLPINNSVFIASNLSVIIECENKLEASSSRSAIDGKTTEAESRAKVLTKGRNPPMIGENPERPAKFQKANCAENLPVHQNSSSGILKKYEPPCKEPPAATPPLIRNFTAPIKFSVKDCPPPINSESVLMNVVGKANPKPEIVRADEDLRPEIEIREASHESEPIRFNSQRFNTDGILMKYEKKNRKTTLRRDCITEYVEPPEEEKVEEAQQPNEEPPCDITSLQTARIHKGLTFSIFRDVVSLAILHVTMIGSVYYVSNVIFVTEQQVILRWLILCAVVGAAILFLWNTVYVVLIGVIAHIMSRLRLECMKKILRVVVPKEVEAIVIKYAFKTISLDQELFRIESVNKILINTDQVLQIRAALQKPNQRAAESLGMSSSESSYEQSISSSESEEVVTQGSWSRLPCGIGIRTELPLHEKIPFQCDSMDRRNVSKYVFRHAIRNYNTTNFQRRYMEQGLNLRHEENLRKELEEAKETERDKSLNKGTKDYTKTIRKLLCSPRHRTVMKCAFEDLRDKFADGDYGAIKPGNQRVYKQTVEDYCDYVQNLEERLANGAEGQDGNQRISFCQANQRTLRRIIHIDSKYRQFNGSNSTSICALQDPQQFIKINWEDASSCVALCLANTSN